MTRPKTTTAYVFRTEMIGGGTSYDVHFLKKDKPSYPLHGSTYATVICRDGKEFFSVYDAIDRKARWSLTPGLDKWDTHKRHAKRAERLEMRLNPATPTVHATEANSTRIRQPIPIGTGRNFSMIPKRSSE